MFMRGAHAHTLPQKSWHPDDVAAARDFLAFHPPVVDGDPLEAAESATGVAAGVVPWASDRRYSQGRAAVAGGQPYLPFLFVKDYKTASEAVYTTLFHYIKGVCENGKLTNLNDYCATGKLGHGSVKVGEAVRWCRLCGEARVVPLSPCMWLWLSQRRLKSP